VVAKGVAPAKAVQSSEEMSNEVSIFQGGGNIMIAPISMTSQCLLLCLILKFKKRLLQNQSQVLQTQLDLINKRLNGLEKKGTESSQEE
jgi:hypothetical protein